MREIYLTLLLEVALLELQLWFQSYCLYDVAVFNAG